MAGEGEYSMMDCDLPFVYQYIDPDGELIEIPYCPSTNIFFTHSEPCNPFNPMAITEVQAITSGSSAAQSAEVSTSNVESCGAQAKRRATESFDASRAEELTDSEGKEKRVRTSNWSNDESEAFLRLKLEALEKSEKSWFRFVSDPFWKRCEIKREKESCQQQWDLLYKAYKAIGNLHDLKSQSEEHPVLFWDMDESARRAMKRRWNEDLKYLPEAFPKDWYDLMEKIIFLQAPVRKSQDIEANHRGESNRKLSTSTLAYIGSGALDSSTIPPNQALVSGNVLCHDCITQQSNDKIMPDEELMSGIRLLVDKQNEQALIPELLQTEEDDEQKYRENLHAREEEHQRRLKAIEAEHSQRLLAIEAEHSRRLQAIQAELLRETEEVEQKHRKSLLDTLDEEELAASLKLTTIKERKWELA